MPLTRDFKQTVQERAWNDPEFRIGLLTEAAECLLNDEVNVAKTLLRDYVNATIGFQALCTLTDKKSQSLIVCSAARAIPVSIIFPKSWHPCAGTKVLSFTSVRDDNLGIMRMECETAKRVSSSRNELRGRNSFFP